MAFGRLAFRELREDIQFYLENPGRMRGVPSGFTNLDLIMGGMEPGIHTVAARPSVGKSAVALAMSYNIVNTLADPTNPDAGNYRVWYASQEMRVLKCVERLAAAQSGISFNEIKWGWRKQGNQRVKLDREDYNAFFAAGKSIINSNLLFRFGPVRAKTLVQELAEAQEAGNLPHLLVIDYLTHMLPDQPGMKGYDAINVNLDVMKTEMVERFNIPVLLVCQIGRGTEGRENKRPTLSDLEGSGHIEQWSKTVTMLYFPDYYGIRNEPDTYQPTKRLELMVLKNQDGGTGTAHLYYDTHIQKLEDWREPGELARQVDPVSGELGGADLSGDSGIGSSRTIHPDGTMDPVNDLGRDDEAVMF